MDNQQDGRYNRPDNTDSNEDVSQNTDQQNADQQGTAWQSTDPKTGPYSENTTQPVAETNSVFQTTAEPTAYPGQQTKNLNTNGEINGKTEPPGVLDIIYGTLFDSARTFASFAENPHLKAVLTIFIALNLAGILAYMLYLPLYVDMLSYTLEVYLDPAKYTANGLGESICVSLASMILSFIKLFFVAGMLHLLADLVGGKGKARSVFAVCGVAGLPAVFMIPVTIILALTAQKIYNGLLLILVVGNISMYIWCVYLVIIGMREVHHISTGRSFAIVVMPWVALICFFILYMIFMSKLSA